MIRILVAMEREAEALGLPCEVIGIGAVNLPETSPDDILINVGYCGGYQIPVGTVIEPLFAGDAETEEVEDLAHHFPCEMRPCFTSDAFVTEPICNCPVIYDMELFKIRKLPHKELYCLKIVSDNLIETDCEAFRDDEAWERVRTLLKGAGLI